MSVMLSFFLLGKQLSTFLIENSYAEKITPDVTPTEQDISKDSHIYVSTSSQIREQIKTDTSNNTGETH